MERVWLSSALKGGRYPSKTSVRRTCPRGSGSKNDYEFFGPRSAVRTTPNHTSRLSVEKLSRQAWRASARYCGTVRLNRR
jgi:hypothetical protein